MMTIARNLPRGLVVLTMAVTLLGGLFSGLARLGWQTDPLSQSWILIHGPLMICGFLGTMISLERAVALSATYRWGYGVPIVSALGAVALLFARDALIAKVLITLASVGLVAMQAPLLGIHPLRYMVVMTLGAVCWVAGNVLWLAGYPIYHTVHLWTAFLILTIVGERLELSRVRRLPPRIENALSVAIALYLAGVALSILTLDWGIRLLGLGALLMAIWLMRYDITRITIRRDGIARYIAACLLPGYFWLGVGGIIGMWKGELFAGLGYAAMLHAFLLGFVFSMIFGHAPIILPAITGLRLQYHPIFYVHLVFLHVTLLLRVGSGLVSNLPVQRWSGLLNVVAVLLFMLATVIAVILSNRPQGKAVPAPRLSPLK